TGIITISGGEPLLHPDLDQIIAHIRRRGAIAGLITNGYLLTPERIGRLNRARLDYLQISIDNAQPDEVSKKSLKVLDRKLQWLAEHAEFHVNINSVIGSGIHHPEDALTVARRAVALGLTSTLGIIHDGSGQLRPLSDKEREVFHEVKALGGQRAFARWDQFQRNISEGKPHDWRCRAGSRYLDICEDGLVHYCSQQRGRPGVPLAEYTTADLRREFSTTKHCAPRCTISCVQQVGMLDNWRRRPQTLKPAPRRAKPVGPTAAAEPLVHLQTSDQ
ncbi:MAG: radical SAM protein, partial [Terriglobales bacterium]